MYLIDTSVLIDFLKGRETKQSKKLEYIIMNKIPFGISAFSYQELLQGAKDESEYKKLKRYLSTQKIYYPTHRRFNDASKLFFSCRKKGITIRGTIDALIAVTAINEELILLNSDRDFEKIAKVADLKVG